MQKTIACRVTAGLQGWALWSGEVLSLIAQEWVGEESSDAPPCGWAVP